MIVPRGARGDARAKRTHWGIHAPWDALRYRCARASHHHFLCLFNAAPPQTPPPKAKILKRKWLVGAGVSYQHVLYYITLDSKTIVSIIKTVEML